MQHVSTRLLLLFAFLFLLMKLPMVQVPNNPEELRDYDAFVLTAEGILPYKDMIWNYGPLSPLVYGSVLKIFPQTLLTVRLVSLLLWIVTALFVLKTMALFFQKRSSLIMGFLITSGVMAYPSYSHNHVLAAFFLALSGYYLVLYSLGGPSKQMWISYLAILGCLFTRPVVMGYGAMGAWLFIFCWTVRAPLKIRVQYLSGFLLIGLFFRYGFEFIYGVQVALAFVPNPWVVMPSEGYPNIHWLIPKLFMQQKGGWLLLVKEVRGSLETFLFYGHYFMWPVLSIALAFLHKERIRYRAAMICAMLGLFASFDTLHYGFTNPLEGQALTVRGQYYFFMTSLSLFIAFWPERWSNLSSEQMAPKLGQVMLLLLVALWSYFPLSAGFYQIHHGSQAPEDMAVMRHIKVHSDRDYIFEAARFLSQKCQKEGYALVGYFPGFRHLTSCEDQFKKDVYAFARDAHYLFPQGESPYYRKGGITNRQVYMERIRQVGTQYFVFGIVNPQESPDTEIFCQNRGLSYQDFGKPPHALRVCYPPTSKVTAVLENEIPVRE